MTVSGLDASVEDAAALGRSIDPVAGLSVPESLLRYERERLADAQMLVRGGRSFSRSFGARR